jgi:hypothetical protein
MSNMGTHIRISTARAIVLLAASALFAVPAAVAQSSQQGGSSQSGSQNQTNGNTQRPMIDDGTDENLPANPDEPIPAVALMPPPEEQITQLGTANPLPARGPFRWGPLYLGASDVRGAVDLIRPSDVAVEGPAQNNVLSLFETSIILDQPFGRSRLTLQYDPRVAITNGQVAYNYLNQNVGVTTYFPLGSRWTLGLSDVFMTTSNAGLQGGVFADANALTSTTLQNDFLDNSETFLTNVASLSLTYGLSPRTLITVSPSLDYDRTSGLTVAEGGNISGLNAGVDLRVRHLLSQRITIGAYASTRFVQFTGLIPSSSYYTFGLSISQQLTATTGYNLDIGATQSVFVGQQKYWDFSGSIAFFKTFQRSRYSILYTRGQPTTGYVTNYLSQRVDAIAHYRLSQRLSADAGVGYQAEQSSPDHVSGTYVSGEMDYMLGRTWSVFGTYAYKVQDSNNVQLYQGTRTFASLGFRWYPNAPGGR